jgi:hypothetical protein
MEASRIARGSLSTGSTSQVSDAFSVVEDAAPTQMQLFADYLVTI